MNIYISSSWKNRDTVRQLATRLRKSGHEVYDFTDPACRKTPEIPPEKFPEQFDPEKHVYAEYINRPDWRAAVFENFSAIQRAELIILLLPCGNDSHADWALGVGLGMRSIVVGCPRKGERSPVHLWADVILPDIEAALKWVNNQWEWNWICELCFKTAKIEWFAGWRRGYTSSICPECREKMKRDGYTFVPHGVYATGPDPRGEGGDGK